MRVAVGLRVAIAANGQKLASLLKEHIAQAGGVVKVAKSGDKPALKQASEKRDQNAVATSTS